MGLTDLGDDACQESPGRSVLLHRRCKQGGMIWSEPGLEAMVALRVAFYNPDTWAQLWPHTAPSAAA